MADESSILDSIKKMLGIAPDYDAFDIDIQVHINSVFSILHSIGASPPAGFIITGSTETWNDFLEDRMHVEMVKSYMYLRVRLLFDPPTTSFALDAFKKQADEMEWRLSTMELTFDPHARDYQAAITELPIPANPNSGPYKIDANGNVWVEI